MPVLSLLFANGVPGPQAALHPVAPLAAAAAATALMAAGIFAGTGSRKRYRDLETSWRSYAAAKGASFVFPSTLERWFSRAAPRMVAEFHGVTVDLTVEEAAAGSATRTIANAALGGPGPDFVVVIHRRAGPGAPATSGGKLVEAPTGNKVFDAGFALLSNEPDLARSILDRRLAHVVAGFPRAFASLAAERNRFVLAWDGLETEHAVLDAATELLATACRRRA